MQDKIFEISRSITEALLRAMPIADPCQDPNAFRNGVKATLESHLPSEAANALKDLSSGLAPYVVLRTSADLSNLPETPTTFAPQPNSSWWPIAWMTIGAMAIADARLISYRCENDGAAFVNLVSMPVGAESVRLSEKSGSAMRGHTDAVSFPFPSEYSEGDNQHSPSPDLLILVCLKNPEGVPTNIALLEEILQELTDDEENALKELHYGVTSQRTFKTDYKRIPSALLSDREDQGLSFRFSHSSVTTIDTAPEEAISALKKIQSTLPNIYMPLPLQPGDICILNNRTVVHGRGAPGNAFGGSTRWLLRTYGWREGTIGNIENTDIAHLHT